MLRLLCACHWQAMYYRPLRLILAIGQLGHVGFIGELRDFVALNGKISSMTMGFPF